MKRHILFVASLLLLVQGSLMAQGKFSGYMFGDYYFNVERDASYPTLANTQPSAAMPGTTAMQAFQFRRIYLTYDNDISETFTARLRFEMDQAANASNGKIGSFVKDAYLRWKNVFDGSDLFFGIQPPPAYEVSEAAWGYRSLDKTIMDLRGIVSSRDFGLGMHGKLTNDGMFNYWVMIGNNSANSPAATTHKYMRYYAHVQVKPTSNLQATLYVDFKDVADVTNASGSKVSNATITPALFVGYAEPFKFNVNVEAFMASQSNAYTPPGGSLGTKSALGYSLFGTYFIQPELGIVLRYDSFDPNTDSHSKGDLRNYILAGLTWKVDKNVQIMPNVLYETYETPTTPGAKSIDPSITARLTLYYVFL
jgi:hypothetical protein